MGSGTRHQEIKAINYIKEMANEAQTLNPFILDGDSGPITDGRIDVHSSHDLINKTFLGSVEVQVKARSRKEGTKPPKSFGGFQRTDLEAQRAKGGILLLVVDLVSHGQGKFEVAGTYYNDLSVSKLNRILNRVAPTVVRPSVRIKPLSEESPSAFRHLLEFALETQTTTQAVSFEMIDSHKIAALEYRSISSNEVNRPTVVDPESDDDSIVIMVMRDGARLRLDSLVRIIPGDYLPVRREGRIECDGAVYDSAEFRRIDDDTAQVKLSPGLQLNVGITEGSNSLRATIRLDDKLMDRRRDLTFYLGMSAGHKLTLHDQVLTPETSIREETHEWLSHLQVLNELATDLDSLGADPHLVDLTVLTEEQWDMLGYIHHLLNGGTPREVGVDGPYRMRVMVGELCLELVIIPATDGRSADVYPLTSSDLPLRILQMNGDQYVQVTPYDALENEWFPKIINLNLSQIVEVYRTIDSSPSTTTRANGTILKLILASDKYPDRSHALLDAADRLNEWVIETDAETTTAILNRLQIVRRRRKLTFDEQRAVRQAEYQAQETPHMARRTEVQIGCALLLGDTAKADFLIDKLEPEHQTTIRSWPIWRLRDVDSLPTKPVEPAAVDPADRLVVH